MGIATLCGDFWWGVLVLGASVTEQRGSDATGSNNEPRWTADDVRKFLKVSRSWVYQHVDSGELPHHRYGALLRFDPETIRKYARGEKVALPNVIALKIQR